MSEDAASRAVLRVGTRGSPLALAQSGQTASRLEKAGFAVELVVIRSSGDQMADVPLAQFGGKGLFIKELEEALRTGRVDLAIHSMKDMPAELPSGFEFGAVPERADERDVLILDEDARAGKRATLDGDAALEGLPEGARIGTGSLRRRAQILARRPDLVMLPMRGNVDTRLEKLRNGEVDGLVLAAAGVDRLGLKIQTRAFDPKRFLPSPGQGALAVEVRSDDSVTREKLAILDDAPTNRACFAERAFLRELGASCVVPVAARAWSEEADATRIEGFVASLDGATVLQAGIEGDYATVGTELARRLIDRGARQILEKVEKEVAAQSVGGAVGDTR